MKFSPLYHSERLEKRLINPNGTAGVITLWSKWRNIAARIGEKHPSLLEPNSPVVLFSNLYGNGLSMMLSNLAYNPQITKLAIVGGDSKIVPSSSYLINFLEKGVDLEQIGDTQLAKIRGTSFYIDPKLKPELFSHIDVRRFSTKNYDGLYDFLTREDAECNRQRLKIKLDEPSFSYFPSDITTHQIKASSPLDAWMEIVQRLNRYGKDVRVKKGLRIKELLKVFWRLFGRTGILEK